MAYKENEEKDEKKEMLIALTGIGIIIFFFLWNFVFSKPETAILPVAEIKTVPKIDFEYLESEEFQNLENYETIEALEKEFMGRENPFLGR